MGSVAEGARRIFGLKKKALSCGFYSIQSGFSSSVMCLVW